MSGSNTNSIFTNIWRCLFSPKLYRLYNVGPTGVSYFITFYITKYRMTLEVIITRITFLLHFRNNVLFLRYNTSFYHQIHILRVYYLQGVYQQNTLEKWGSVIIQAVRHFYVIIQKWQHDVSHRKLRKYYPVAKVSRY